MVYFFFLSEPNVMMPEGYIIEKIVAHRFPKEISKMYRQHNGGKIIPLSPANFPTITFHDVP